MSSKKRHKAVFILVLAVFAGCGSRQASNVQSIAAPTSRDEVVESTILQVLPGSQPPISIARIYYADETGDVCVDVKNISSQEVMSIDFSLAYPECSPSTSKLAAYWIRYGSRDVGEGQESPGHVVKPGQTVTVTISRSRYEEMVAFIRKSCAEPVLPVLVLAKVVFADQTVWNS